MKTIEKTPSTAPVRQSSVGMPAWVWPVAIVLGGLTVVVAGLAAGVTGVQQLSDPGGLTRWGLPITKVIHSLAWATTVGALVFACAILPRWAGPSYQIRRAVHRGETVNLNEHPTYTRVMLIASISSVIWTLSALSQLVFTYSDMAGMPLNASPEFSIGLVDFVLSIAVGRAWFAMTLIAAVVTSLIFGLRGATSMAFTAVLALIGIVPMALIGHSSSGDDHFAAVNSIGLHLLGVLLWVGGLLVLGLSATTLIGQDRARETAGSGVADQPLVYVVLARFSVLAALSIMTVALSGVINADIRMNSINELALPYGVLIVAKFLITVLLALVGFAHRQVVIPQLKTGSAEPGPGAKRLLWRLIGVEVVLMVVITTVAVILARTEPPKPEEEPPEASPARLLTGYELPPELTFDRWFTEWRLNWLWVAIIVFLALWYLRAFLRLRRRGDNWPVLRLVSFMAGLVVLMWVTSGAPAVYGMILFSAHMVAHMTLTMIAPLFMVLGAPITLAMRSLPARADGTRGPREWMLWLLQSWWAKLVTHPIFAAINFAGSILIFYYTPFFGFALDQHIGHELMNFHFLITGFIFASVMVGIDPLPHRPNYPLRLVLLLATMVFHAFIGVAMTGSESLLEAEWFSAIGRDWGPSAIADQQIGGAIMWGIGEFPTVIMAIITVVQWRRHDLAVAARRDRRADRDGDAELQAWNQMYAQMATEDEYYADSSSRHQ
ncbi:cytochrome c oxidase assembly protein [Auritidibacter ignavus]|uniref:Cytochrome c oxidase assembly protein n=1 Tax=Auritidibacter ignavus TaxID=678932 RepID=A0AAJ6DCA6_9MICC|nr:cytochrome c oxidase assembly protein [Auritidibacter ignavus]WGH90580.1 cytochrome c oxidase assembly protein [Auritidibacter ignavus]WGH92956.1 cytochrome c oxidase assembly protein [Auritidibacter ignavus]